MRGLGHPLLTALGAAVCVVTLSVAPSARAADAVKVFAAASLKNALDAVDAAYKADTGKDTSVSYAASSALAKQVESGAPADVFLSADLDWMDYLEERQLIDAGSRTTLLGNDLVLVAGQDNAAPVDIRQDFDLKSLLAGGKLAMGAVDSVPAGKYGKAALEKLGVWPSIKSDVAGAENVRAALLLVSRGEAPYGIVYKTDAAADKGVTIVGTFPQDSHPPIVYPMAMMAGTTNPDIAGYLDFLRSGKAAALFRENGFTVIAPSN